MSVENESTGDLATGESRLLRPLYIQSPERLASPPASLGDRHENSRSNGPEGDEADEVKDRDLENEQEATDELPLRYRQRRPYQTRKSLGMGRSESATLFIEDVGTQNAKAASDDETVDKDAFEKRLEDSDLQQYSLRKISNEFQRTARRGSVGGQKDYWDDYGPEERRYRNMRHDSFNHRERRFEHVPRGDKPRYEDRYWDEDEDIQSSGNRRRGRRTDTYDERNPFTRRKQSEERLRPNLRNSNPYGFVDGSDRNRVRSPLNMRRIELDEDRVRRRYVPPIGKSGESLKVDIKSVPATKDEHLPPHSPRPVTSATPKGQSLSFEASCGTLNDAGMETVYLNQKLSNEPLGATHLRWIHKQESCMSIEGFQDLLGNAGLNQDDLLMTLRLLSQVAARAKKELNHSYVLEPLVIRGDATQLADKQNEDSARQHPVVNMNSVHSRDDPYQSIPINRRRARVADRHCTFVNFPYFALQSLQSDRGNNLKYRHPRGLLQTLYRLESTASREKEQAICKDRNSSDKSICVPQLWSIIVGTGKDYNNLFTPFLIRPYRPEYSHTKVFSDSSFKLAYTEGHGHVPDDAVLLFGSMQELELQELVYSQFEYSQHTHCLLLKDGPILDALMWQCMISASEITIINLLIQFKEIQYPTYRGSAGSDTSTDAVFIKNRNGQPDTAHNYPVRLQTRRTVETNPGAMYEKSAYNHLNNTNMGRDFWPPGQHQTYSPSMYNDDRLFTIARQQERRSRTLQIPHTRDNLYNQNNFIIPYYNQTSTDQRIADKPLLLREADPMQTRSAYAAGYVPQMLQRSATMDTDLYNNRGVEYLRSVERRNEPITLEPNTRFYRPARSPPAPDGIISNQIWDDSENNMYFVPRTERRATGEVETGQSGHSFRAADILGTRSHGRNRMQDLPTSKADSNRAAGNGKNIMIPIFLWPTGFPDSTEKTEGWAGIWDGIPETKSTKSVEETVRRGPPPRRVSAKKRSQADAASLSKILESVVDSFADSSQASELFRSMPSSDVREWLSVKDSLKPPDTEREHQSAPEDMIAEGTPNRQFSLEGDLTLSTDSLGLSINKLGKERPHKEEKGILGAFEAAQRRQELIAIQNEAIRRRPAIPQPPPDARHLPSSDESSIPEAEEPDGKVDPPEIREMEGKLSTDLDNELKDEIYYRRLRLRLNDPLLNDSVSENKKPQYLGSVQLEDQDRPNTAAKPLRKGILTKLESERDELLVQFEVVSRGLLGKFIPSRDKSVVTTKYSGTVKRCTELVRMLYDDCFLGKKANSADIWIIDDINIILHTYHQTLPRPSLALANCEKCRSRLAYATEAEALQHLVKVHFHDGGIKKNDARLWIKQESQHVEREEQYQQILTVFKHCIRILKRASKKVQEIEESVFTSDNQIRSCYRLPNTLVESFCTILRVLLWTSLALARASKNINNTRIRTSTEVEEISVASSHLRTLGRQLLFELENGKKDLMEMARLQQQSRNYRKAQEIGPQYVLGMILSNLQLGVNCEDLLDVYTRYIERLSFQANQFPRRRLIRSFIYLDEETKIIYETITHQINLLTDFWQVLDPNSFKTTTESRASMFELEKDLIKKTQKWMDVKRADLLGMGFQIERLIQQTKTSLEIKDDDHGKAILVFTIVTLVFLPLSFVSSFFGMNTVDIRDMNSSQTVFWTVAVPVTVGVMVLALVIGYKFDAIREQLETMVGKSKMD